jgi:hypothetical protein
MEDGLDVAAVLDGRHDAVIAGGAETLDAGEFDEPALRSAPGEYGDEIDGLGD